MNTHVLPLHAMTRADHLVHPEEYSDVRLDSPALALFTDFRRHDPIVIDGWTRAVDAERAMRESHTRLRLVVDHAGEVLGTITLDDLSERQVIRRVAAGDRREDILVTDLMTRRSALKALSFDDLQRATVRHVIDTLSSHGERHCLVVDFGHHAIRGLIAASDVARRLHMSLQLDPAPTFAAIFAVVHDGREPTPGRAVGGAGSGT